MAIKLLPEQVINQIAAGEVVERPSSVVKELVDNALDSGTKSIRVSITNGGQSLIHVIDQGCGMSREDALLSFERHATSKISKLDDLNTISTNGFRGEALSSISSVSSVTLRTKEIESELGTQVDIRGGKITNVSSISCLNGTSIEVKNLFFNVPARKKFLKSQRVEEAKITELLCAYALGYWWIDFEYTSDGKTILNLPASKEYIQRAKKIIKGNASEINYTFDDIKVTGLLGHPGNASSQGTSLTILVNNRFVHDRFVLRAVKEGFLSTLKEKEFPVGVISLNLPGHIVDVNVHPQKSEVRFANSQKVFAAVKTAVEESIREFRGSRSIETTTSNYFSEPIKNYALEKSNFVQQYANLIPSSLSTTEIDSPTNVVFSSPSNTGDLKSNDFKFLAQIFKCYLLFEGLGKFIIIDMHAAHERINYNKLLAAYKLNAKSSQALMFPSNINLNQLELSRFTEISDYIQKLGFEFNIHSDSIEVLAVPSILQKLNFESLIKESIRDDDLSIFSLEESLAYRFARLACHASIRGGDIISREESYALLEQILSADFGSACPHGRPCIIEYSKEQIESWFGRDK